MVWYALEMEMTMVWISLPFPCMVCIGNEMVWYGIVWNGMHWQWYGMLCYALAMEMEMV
jgi:hypothetical protein